jgi:hypothetical protein
MILNLKKQHLILSYMKYINYVIVVALSIVVATACSNQNEENTYPTPQSSEALSQYNDRMEVIAAMSNDYEQSIIEALSERNRLKNSASAPAFDVEQRIKTLFSEKCSKYPSVEPQPQTKSGASEEFFIDAQKLQQRLDNLAELLENAIEAADDDSGKEEILANLQKVSDSYLATILSDETLLDVEKQQIRENVVFRTSVALTSIKYGEEVADLLLPETKGCNWWCRVKRAARCTFYTACAVAICGTSITNYPTSVLSWGLCVENYL